MGTQPEVIRIEVERAKRIAEEALQVLTKELESGKSATLKAYLSAMARFPRYSLRNTLLITSQRPDATRVAGFRAWRQLGRHVRKGERGIAILAPIVYRKRNGKDRQNTRAHSVYDDDRLAGFRTAYVFDLSQTQGNPLPAFAIVRGSPGVYLERLKNLVTRRGVRLTFTPRIAPALGVSVRGEIMLLPGLPPAEEFTTLAHELAHTMLHESVAGNTRNKTVLETEAEAVAFVVCQAIGLETGSASSDYIQLWEGNTRTLTASLSRIRGAASEIIKAVQVAQPEAQAVARVA